MTMLYELLSLSPEEIQAMFAISDLKNTKAYQEAVEKGRELGFEKGLEKALEHVRSLLIQMLTYKIGMLSPQLAEAVMGLSFEALEELGLALFDFEGAEDLQAWLESH